MALQVKINKSYSNTPEFHLVGDVYDTIPRATIVTDQELLSNYCCFYSNNTPVVEWFIEVGNLSISLGPGIKEIVSEGGRNVWKYCLNIPATPRFSVRRIYPVITHGLTVINDLSWRIFIVRPKGATGSKGLSAIEAGVAPGVGNPGPRGSSGYPGSIGYPGNPGSDGLDGPEGPAGTNGVDGLDGLDGLDGVNGVDGINGLNGDPYYIGKVFNPVDIISSGRQIVVDKIIIHYKLYANLANSYIPRFFLNGTTAEDLSKEVVLLESIKLPTSFNNESKERSVVIPVNPDTYTQIRFMIINYSSLLELRAIKLHTRTDKAVENSIEAVTDIIDVPLKAGESYIVDGYNDHIFGYLGSTLVGLKGVTPLAIPTPDPPTITSFLLQNGAVSASSGQPVSFNWTYAGNVTEWSKDGGATWVPISENVHSMIYYTNSVLVVTETIIMRDVYMQISNSVSDSITIYDIG